MLRMFVGSPVSWVRLLLKINSSDANPSGSSTSPGHHCLDLQLKSSVITMQCGVQLFIQYIVNGSLLRNKSKLAASLVGMTIWYHKEYFLASQ